jgi:hypothetical protein
MKLWLELLPLTRANMGPPKGMNEPLVTVGVLPPARISLKAFQRNRFNFSAHELFMAIGKELVDRRTTEHFPALRAGSKAHQRAKGSIARVADDNSVVISALFGRAQQFLAQFFICLGIFQRDKKVGRRRTRSLIIMMTAFQKAEALATQRYDRYKLLAMVDEVIGGTGEKLGRVRKVSLTNPAD